ncbi:MAG TPA: hypothetical protein VFV49_18260, partial [Thermoanaerobaculia bacterium]|nr:hypothetical protein [Thermoanaerobaculia bacterium]
MNRQNRALYLLPIVMLALLGATACDRAEGRSARRNRGNSDSVVTITRNWPAASIRELRVFEVDGSISV